MLHAANGDPLRAQEMDEELLPEWWRYWLIYSSKMADAQEKKSKKYDRY